MTTPTVGHRPTPKGATSTAASGSTGGLRSWSARHPVAAFLVLAFILAYPVMSVPILADHGVIADGWMPQVPGVDTERIASVLLVFLALVPAALWVTWAVDGAAGVRALVRRMCWWRIGARWGLLVLAGLPTLTTALALALGDNLKPVDLAPFLVTQMFGFLVNLFLINLWEETAWSGVVQTRLEERHGLVRAALLTAVPFALAHLPLHFIGEFSLGSLATALVSLLIVCTVVRLMIGVFLRATSHSILAVAVVHTTFNRSNNEEGLVAGLLEGDSRNLAGLLAVGVLTTAVAVVTRRRTGQALRLDPGSPATSPAPASTAP
jgi:membrane protease YdiL (CAAX protease family)